MKRKLILAIALCGLSFVSLAQTRYRFESLSSNSEITATVNSEFNINHIDTTFFRNRILNAPRYAGVFAGVPALSDIRNLIRLKEIIELLPVDRGLGNGDKLGIGTPFVASVDPCSYSNPNNTLSNFDRVSVNYLLGGILAPAPVGAWAPAVFSLNTKDVCTNKLSPIMYVGLDKKFGFGTDKPEATYHFKDADALFGPIGGYHFSVTNVSGKQSLQFANGNDLLFLVDKSGKVFAKEFEVALTLSFPDYVFEKEYKLLSLDSLSDYISNYKHLPGIKSACDYESEGKINVAELQLQLVQKVEELTLYILEQQKQMKAQAQEIKKLEQQILNSKN